MREAAASHGAARPGAPSGCRICDTVGAAAPLQHEIPIARRASPPAGAAGSVASALQVGPARAYPPIDGDEAADPQHDEERHGN